MPVTDADQDRPGARECVRRIVAVVLRHPPKGIADMARKDVQVEVAKIMAQAMHGLAIESGP